MARRRGCRKAAARTPSSHAIGGADGVGRGVLLRSARRPLIHSCGRQTLPVASARGRGTHRWGTTPRSLHVSAWVLSRVACDAPYGACWCPVCLRSDARHATANPRPTCHPRPGIRPVLRPDLAGATTRHCSGGVLAERLGSVVVVLDGVAYVATGFHGLAAVRRLRKRGNVAPLVTAPSV